MPWPRKYRRALVEKICEILRAGNTRMAAYRAVGIDSTTFYNWLKMHPEFAEAVEKAEAEAELLHVSNIVAAAKQGNWTASAWWLERRRPEQWGRHDRIEHSHKGELEITLRWPEAPTESEPSG